VVGVHLVGGIVGALFTGVFASAAVNGFSGGLVQLGRQALAVGATMAFSFAMTLGILKVVDMLVGVRVSEEEELTGLDLSQHSEVAYTSSEGSGSLPRPQDTVITVPEMPTPAVQAYRETRVGAP
jgi:ammonia channel protein AmtB